MSLQTPRVLPAHLHAFHPSSSGPRSAHTVRLLGTVTALRGDTATITCGNNGDVTLILKPDSHLQMGKLVEVIGKVTDLENGQGVGLRLLGSTDWGNPADCDYKIYENLVNVTHRFKTIFYDSNE
ncbi:putative ssDNA binding protein Ssb3 [Aspergillus heteromorphus CBS 117.55]|uniref:Putative ssDNA binding protein Ssb3 n=1 Tax=Aspergillus heteromorphus CBS 117.55 TaxID=1448321 RepID=A0A317UZI5_9EURO|nr:putative ssDNA binding protein Ssb3 [Aspergillus heteromorphus CBS 117.55]PWY67195.1 putative ssDNA binding protein Ssb3 [Aspergillus heteromorphus CBS 117.55]